MEIFLNMMRHENTVEAVSLLHIVYVLIRKNLADDAIYRDRYLARIPCWQGI